MVGEGFLAISSNVRALLDWHAAQIPSRGWTWWSDALNTAGHAAGDELSPDRLPAVDCGDITSCRQSDTSFARAWRGRTRGEVTSDDQNATLLRFASGAPACST